MNKIKPVLYSKWNFVIKLFFLLDIEYFSQLNKRSLSRIIMLDETVSFTMFRDQWTPLPIKINQKSVFSILKRKGSQKSLF